MQRGYIKVWRKIEDSGLLQLHGTLALFLYMVLQAAYKDKRVGTVDIQRGQLVTGRFKLAEAVGLSEQSTRTSLQHLIDMGMITSKPTNKFTIYTIVNYGQYQDIDTTINQQDNQQLTNNQPTTNQQLTTTKEGKKESIKEKLPFVLPTWVDEDCWNLWLSKRKKMDDDQKRMQIKKLEKWKNAGLDYQDSLFNAAANGYQGLVEPKAKFMGQQIIPTQPEVKKCGHPGCNRSMNLVTSKGPRCTEHM